MTSFRQLTQLYTTRKIFLWVFRPSLHYKNILQPRGFPTEVLSCQSDALCRLFCILCENILKMHFSSIFGLRFLEEIHFQKPKMQSVKCSDVPQTFFVQQACIGEYPAQRVCQNNDFKCLWRKKQEPPLTPDFGAQPFIYQRFYFVSMLRYTFHCN